MRLIILLFINILIASLSFAQEESNIQQDPYLAIVEAYKNGKFTDCIQLCDNFIMKSPISENNAKVKIFLGMSYMKTKQEDLAIRTFIEHDRDYPAYEKNEQIKFLLGKLYYEQNDYDNSELVLNDQITKYPAGKYLSKAQEILTAINQIREQERLKEASDYMTDEDDNLYKEEYSFTKITWAKIASATCLFAVPAFLVLGNNAQTEADDIYNNKYKPAENTDDAEAYYKQADDFSQKAARYKTAAFFSGIGAVGFFIYDYFEAGRVRINIDDKELSFNYSF